MYTYWLWPWHGICKPLSNSMFHGFHVARSTPPWRTGGLLQKQEVLWLRSPFFWTSEKWNHSLFWSHFSLFLCASKKSMLVLHVSFRIIDLNSASRPLRIVEDPHKHKLVGAASSGTPLLQHRSWSLQTRAPWHLAKNLHPWTSNPIYEFHSHITYTEIQLSSIMRTEWYRKLSGWLQSG